MTLNKILVPSTGSESSKEKFTSEPGWDFHGDLKLPNFVSKHLAVIGQNENKKKIMVKGNN